MFSWVQFKRPNWLWFETQRRPCDVTLMYTCLQLSCIWLKDAVHVFYELTWYLLSSYKCICRDRKGQAEINGDKRGQTRRERWVLNLMIFMHETRNMKRINITIITRDIQVNSSFSSHQNSAIETWKYKIYILITTQNVMLLLCAFKGGITWLKFQRLLKKLREIL